MNVNDFDKPEHAQFVVNYFKLNMNGTRAYKATYGDNVTDESAATSASRLLRNVKVSAYITSRLQENIMKPDELLSRVSELARSEHGHYVTKNGTVDIAKLVEDGKAHLVRSVKRDKYGNPVYDFHDPKPYLEMQGKYYALWKDKIEIESPLEREVLQLLKNGDITPQDVLDTLGDSDRTKKLINKTRN